jgi:multicomponent Na+:H+ antiporter subunit D
MTSEMMSGFMGVPKHVFFVPLPAMKRTPTITLDVDWLWRSFCPRTFEALLTGSATGRDAVLQAVRRLSDIVRATASRGRAAADGMSRSRPVGTTALGIAVLLSAYVLAYYL